MKIEGFGAGLLPQTADDKTLENLRSIVCEQKALTSQSARKFFPNPLGRGAKMRTDFYGVYGWAYERKCVSTKDHAAYLPFRIVPKLSFLAQSKWLLSGQRSLS